MTVSQRIASLPMKTLKKFNGNFPTYSQLKCKRPLLSSFSFATIWKNHFTIPLFTPVNQKVNKHAHQQTSYVSSPHSYVLPKLIFSLLSESTFIHLVTCIRYARPLILDLLNMPEAEQMEAKQDLTLQEELGLAPRTIVLAKVKGYRAWPAMVLDEEILPDNIKKLKPKSVKQQKKTLPTILVPVRFFSDDTYIWIRNHDLKVLLDNDIQLFLDKHSTAGKKKDELLVFAYELAQNPPDMTEFNLWGSRGPPDLDPEPPQKKLKLKLNLKPKDKKGKKQAPAKPKTPKKAKVERYSSYEEYEKDLENASEPENDEYGSDWGLNDSVFNFETGDYVFEDEKEQSAFVSEFPTSAELQENSAYFNEQFELIFQKVAPALLDGEISNENTINKELRAAGKLAQEAPLAVFTKSPLYRSLLVAAHKPEEKLPSKSVKSTIANLLKNFCLETCTLTMEDLVLPTPQETPNQTPGLTPGPENGIKQESETAAEVQESDSNGQEQLDASEAAKTSTESVNLVSDVAHPHETTEFNAVAE